jgi:DNA replication protein DnaC
MIGLTSARIESNLDYLGLKGGTGQRGAGHKGWWSEQRRQRARFPYLKTIDQFDFDFQSSVDRKRIKELLTLRLIENGEDVIILGPTGVGKTHLAIAIGMAACQPGESVSFTTAAELTTSLPGGLDEGRFKRRPKTTVIDH